MTKEEAITQAIGRKTYVPALMIKTVGGDEYVWKSGIAFTCEPLTPEERIAELEKLTRTLVIRQCLLATAVLLGAVIMLIKEIY